MSRRTSIGLLLTLTLGLAAPAGAQTPGPKAQDTPDLDRFKHPKGMPESVEAKAQVTDRRGEQVPLDIAFDDEHGEKVKVGDLLHEGRPFLLQFVYFRCPSLCNEVLNNTNDLFRKMRMVPGKDFDVITISINPKETSNLARAKKEAYIDVLSKARPEAKEPATKNWRFLTGSAHNIAVMAKAAGFGFKFDTVSREYAHGAGLFVLTPEGKISRTIYGASYNPQTVRLSLIEASQNRIGTALDRIILYCYCFDPATGKYTPQIMNIVRVICGLTVLFLAVLVAGLVYSSRRKAAATSAADAAQAAESAESGPSSTQTPATPGPGEVS